MIRPTPSRGNRDEGLAALVAGRRRLVVSLVIGLLLAAGVVLLIGRASGFAKLVSRLREADPGWLVAAGAAQVLSVAGYVLAFRTLSEANGRRPAAGATVHIVLASLGATRLLATAGAGGLAVNYWALRRLGLEARESVIRVLTLNTVLYLVFGLAGLVSAATMLASGAAPAALALPWIVAVAAAMAAARYVSQPGRVDRLSREPPARAEQSRLVATARRGFATSVAGVARVRDILTAPRAHGPLLGGVCLYWTADIACLGMGLAAFDVDVSLGVLVLGYLTGYVANILPIPTGGVGGVDAAMTFALNALGVPLEEALAGVIGYRFVGFWLPTIPAAWAFITLPRLSRSLAGARPESRSGGGGPP